MMSGGGGAGGGLKVLAEGHLGVDDDVAGSDIAINDVRDQPLISWGTGLELPTIAEGDSLGVAWGTTHHLLWGRGENVYLPYPPTTPGGTDYVSGGAPIGPVLSSPGAAVQSLAAWHNTPWTFTPAAFGCGIGGGSWSGWREQEWWTSIVVPAHPADLAGIYVDVTLHTFKGAATGGIVYVRSSAPVEGRSGTAVATIGAGTTRVLIPAGAVPDAGGQLWVGIGPAWQAQYDLAGQVPHDFPAACNINYTSPGIGNGQFSVSSLPMAAWAIHAAPGGDLGTTVVLDDEDDPFEGGNTLRDFGVTGNPSVSVAGGSLVVEGEGGWCIGALGDREDEEEPAGVWGDPYAAGFQFEFGGSGDGYIELTTTRPGARLRGTISLDGITVATPLDSASAAVAISTGERWAARFDDRSETWFRAKLWRVADGEPAEWTVRVELPEEGTEDTGDRIVLCVHAGAGQTIRVWPVSGAASSQESWIRERLGVASGTQDRFEPSHPFRPGSLHLDVAGVFAPPSREDGESAWLDYQPTAGSVVWATYLTD